MRLPVLVLLVFCLGSAMAEESTPAPADVVFTLLTALPDPEAKARLDQWFAGADGAQRSAALDAIASGVRSEARPWVVVALSEKEPAVLRSALRALAGLGAASAVETAAVIALVDHRDALVAGAAMQCLTAWVEHRAVPALTERLNSDDEGIARAARAALTKLRGEDLGRDPETWRAWYTDERTQFDQSFAPLRETLAGREDRPVAEVVQAIERLTLFPQAVDEAADLLRPLLTDPDGAPRTAAIRILRVLKPREDLPELPPEQPVVPVAATNPASDIPDDGSSLVGWLVISTLLAALGGSGFWWIRQLPVSRPALRGATPARKTQAEAPVVSAPNPAKPARPQPKLFFTR